MTSTSGQCSNSLSGPPDDEGVAVAKLCEDIARKHGVVECYVEYAVRGQQQLALNDQQKRGIRGRIRNAASQMDSQLTLYVDVLDSWQVT